MTCSQCSFDEEGSDRYWNLPAVVTKKLRKILAWTSARSRFCWRFKLVRQAPQSIRHG